MAQAGSERGSWQEGCASLAFHCVKKQRCKKDGGGNAVVIVVYCCKRQPKGIVKRA